MTNIRVSQKHGVNPSMQMCVWCGECKGVVLMGLLKGDVEAPKECFTDIDPCDKCKESMALGVTLVGVSPKNPNNGMPPITSTPKDLYMTGMWAVVAESLIERLNMSDEEKAEVLKQRALIIDEHVFKSMIDEYEGNYGELPTSYEGAKLTKEKLQAKTKEEESK